MKRSSWMSATLIAVLAVVGCEGDEKSAKATAPTATKTPTTTPPVAPPPETPPPTTTTPPTTPPVAPPPVATDGIEGVGPFESIKAYCKDAKSKFVADDCKSMLDGGANMCSCGPNEDDIQGKSKIGPLPEATGLAGAQLLIVGRSAAGGRDCDLAIETANDRGWFVVPALMPCTGAPMSHDSDSWIEVSSFDVSRENDVDVLTLAWTEVESSEDVEDGKETRTETKFTTRCTIGASTPPRCDKPAKQ